MRTEAVSSSARACLSAIADVLIPGTEKMPAPSSIGISEELLDRVLDARPDIAPDLDRVLVEVPTDPIAWLEGLGRDDPPAWHAVTLAVVGGYYMDRQVREAIGYPGQVPEEVVAGSMPEYAEELERVYSRGPRYRQA